MKLLAAMICLSLASSLAYATPSYEESIRQLIRKNMSQVQACYNDYIKEKDAEGKLKEAKGYLTVEWDINHEGKASNFKEKRTSFEDKHVFSCVGAKMAAWQFPSAKSKKKTTTVSFPFVFDIKK